MTGISENLASGRGRYEKGAVISPWREGDGDSGGIQRANPYRAAGRI